MEFDLVPAMQRDSDELTYPSEIGSPGPLARYPAQQYWTALAMRASGKLADPRITKSIERCIAGTKSNSIGGHHE